MRINQASTAIGSYHINVSNGCASGQRNSILNFIKTMSGDWPIGELAHAMDMEKSTVSARVWELLNETKQLEAKDKRVDRISKKTIRPVGLKEFN